MYLILQKHIKIISKNDCHVHFASTFISAIKFPEFPNKSRIFAGFGAKYTISRCSDPNRSRNVHLRTFISAT